MNSESDRFLTPALLPNGAGSHDPVARTSAVRRAGALPERRGGSPRLGRLLFYAVALLGLAFAAGLIPRLLRRASVSATTRTLAIPTVTLVSPSPAKAPPPLVLSGELKPLVEAAIYARASGYVRKWSVDLGSHVEAGQVLAELEIPEVDRQLAQARADWQHAQAARDLAVTTAQRWGKMMQKQTISQQEADERQSAATLAAAAVESAASNVKRLEEMVGFAHVVAPFAGVITARNVDVGQLVTAGSGQELFHLADISKLRVFVRVPQSYSARIAPGQEAQLSLLESARPPYSATIVRTAGAIDAASRTLLTELEVDNATHELLPGSYARVRLTGAALDAALTVPSNALLFRPAGPVVAVLAQDRRISLRPVVLGRDFGPAMEILEGLSAADRIVINPPDSLVDGIEVRVAGAGAEKTGPP